MNIRIFISIVVYLLVLPGKLTGQDWQLVWSDEFEGESLDQGKWSYMIGDGSDYGIPGWGNNEGQYYLEQNYPNPFHPTTTLSFSMPEAEHVILDIFDTTGRKMDTLIDADREPIG